MARLPSHYVRVAGIAGGLATAQALLVAVVTVVLILQHSSCVNVEASVPANSFFQRIIKQHYFQDVECPVREDAPLQEGILAASHLFIWLIIVLAIAVTWLIVSIVLVIVSDESATRYFPAVVYTWVATTVAVTVVDVVLAVLFGLDFGHLDGVLREWETWDSVAYSVDLLRMGAFLLMTLTLKGFVLPIVNISLAVTLTVIAHKSSMILETAQHSLHTQGPLNAYTASSNKRNSDPWQRTQSYEPPFERNGQQNGGFSSDIENFSWRVPQGDTTSRAFDRSDSWHHSRAGPEAGVSRPFSYLDEPRSPMQPPPPAPLPTPTVLPPWRRDPWEQPPPLPAPDYSPVGGRRLKSALKTGI